VSTITVHLELNYDPNAALTQIQAKLAQVRNDLPPESENPVIELQNADELRAAMYLGFAAPDMQPNQVTDFLTRVIQPKLTALPGVQRADILGARVYAMRIWLKPERLAALGVTPTDVRKALQANNYLAAVGKTKGTMTSINLIANTNLTTPDEFRQLVVKQKGACSSACRTSPTSSWDRRITIRMSASTGRTRSSSASGRFPRPIPSTSARASGMPFRNSGNPSPPG